MSSGCVPDIADRRPPRPQRHPAASFDLTREGHLDPTTPRQPPSTPRGTAISGLMSRDAGIAHREGRCAVSSPRRTGSGGRRAGRGPDEGCHSVTLSRWLFPARTRSHVTQPGVRTRLVSFVACRYRRRLPRWTCVSAPCAARAAPCAPFGRLGRPLRHLGRPARCLVRPSGILVDPRGALCALRASWPTLSVPWPTRTAPWLTSGWPGRAVRRIFRTSPLPGVSSGAFRRSLATSRACLGPLGVSGGFGRVRRPLCVVRAISGWPRSSLALGCALRASSRLRAPE
ncbi:hypothetical protein FB559_3566 [Actinoallomurus bryophytorum]|uniref:Uncharacterized protein n=1 Tax=Actinoallomurus bryophytorum TaxID=1490222 RepID=A0A543CLG8_9ACTN|nr:hypothetical protein FB559_3566 [Actinoallomurus bryophytorum]